jgi:hypothetical protein
MRSPSSLTHTETNQGKPWKHTQDPLPNLPSDRRFKPDKGVNPDSQEATPGQELSNRQSPHKS